MSKEEEIDNQQQFHHYHHQQQQQQQQQQQINDYDDENSVENIINGIQNTIQERIEKFEAISDELEEGEYILMTLKNTMISDKQILDVKRELIDRQCLLNEIKENIDNEKALQLHVQQEKERILIEIVKGKEQFIVLSNEIIKQSTILENHERTCYHYYNNIRERYLMTKEELLSFEFEIDVLSTENTTDPAKERMKKLINAINRETLEKKMKLESLTNELNFLSSS